MNILLIQPYAGSRQYGMQYRPYYLAKEWSKLGHHVTIVSASFSHLRLMQPKTSESITEEEIEGIRYIWLKTKEYSDNGAKRVWNMLEFSWRLIRLKKRLKAAYKPDIVIASSPHPFSIFGANIIARSSKAKLVFEVRDLWPLTLIELGKKSPSHPFIMLMQFAENYAYRVSDYVVSLLPEAHLHMIEHGMAAHKFYYFPNGIIVEEWVGMQGEMPNEYENLLERLKVEGNFLVGYAGGHGLANSLQYLLEAADRLREHPVAFILIGNGPDKEELQKRAKENGLTNVWFLDPIPKSAIPKFLDQMDVLFAGLKQESFYRFGMSMNKLFDYMMAAKPIILSAKVGNDLVMEYRCGLSIPPENSEAIADGVMKLKSLTFDERMEIGRRGRERVLSEHNLEILARSFVEEMENNIGKYEQSPTV